MAPADPPTIIDILWERHDPFIVCNDRRWLVETLARGERTRQSTDQAVAHGAVADPLHGRHRRPEKVPPLRRKSRWLRHGQQSALRWWLILGNV